MSCSRRAGCSTLGAGRAAQPSTAALHALHTRGMSTPRERVGQETQSGRGNQRAAWPGILDCKVVGFEWKQDTQALCGDASYLESAALDMQAEALGDKSTHQDVARLRTQTGIIEDLLPVMILQRCDAKQTLDRSACINPPPPPVSRRTRHRSRIPDSSEGFFSCTGKCCDRRRQCRFPRASLTLETSHRPKFHSPHGPV